MTVPFNNIPQQVRVPLFYAEMDNSAANGSASGIRRALAIGQKLAAGGTAAFNVPYIVASVTQAISLFGRGSMLARMVKAYRDNDSFGELWCIAVADAGAGVAATGSITAVGTATQSGTLTLYVGAQRVLVPVLLNDTATVMATSIVTAITALADLPVTATSSAGVVTLTAKWKGPTGNDITLVDSFQGSAGGEALPAGLTLTYAATLTGGTTNPVLTPVISAMGDDEYDFIIHPYTDTTSLDAFATELNDTTGRWSWSRQIYGHAYTAQRGTLSALVTAGGLRNDQHTTIAAIDADCPNLSYEYAAAYGARNAVFINADCARPTQTGVLSGMLVPRAGKKFLFTERQSLLTYGIATSYVTVGALRIERAITTFQKNLFGQPDVSYLDSEILHLSTYVLRRLKSIITSKYPRHKLASDGTRFAAGSAIVTPAVIRGELIAEYKKMEYDGYVENAAAFAANLIVERPASDPNRLDVLYTPDYINQLRVFAALNQFRLQY